MKFCGIDPGKSGAFCILDEEGKLLTTTAKLPWLESDRLDARSVHTSLAKYALDGLTVTIEKVAGFGMGAKSCFTFGRSVGALFAVLDILGVRIIHPTPKMWQKELLAGYPKGDTKAASRQAAYDLFPYLRDGALARKNSHNLADSALIAEFGRRIIISEIKNVK